MWELIDELYPVWATFGVCLTIIGVMAVADALDRQHARAHRQRRDAQAQEHAVKRHLATLESIAARDQGHYCCGEKYHRHATELEADACRLLASVWDEEEVMG